MGVLGQNCVKYAEGLVRRSWAVDERALQTEEVSRLVTCEPSVPKRLLGSLRALIETAASNCHAVSEHVPDTGEPCIVVCLREHGECAASKRFEAVDIGLLPDDKALVGGNDAGEQFTGFVVFVACSLGGSFGDC